MNKTLKILLDLLIVLLVVILVVIVVLPQQKAMKEELKYRQSRTNLYSVRAAIECYIFQNSDVKWDQERNSWSYEILYPECKDDIEKHMIREIINPFGDGNAALNVFFAESSLVENTLEMNIVWDSTEGGQWFFVSSERVLDLWEQSGSEGMPHLMDDTIIISINPADMKIKYEAWESEEKTPSLVFVYIENIGLVYNDTIPPEDETEFISWLFNYTIADYLLAHLPELPENINDFGEITIKYIWPNPPDLPVTRRRREPDSRDSLEVERPYIIYSMWEYPENSFKPSYISKEDDSDTTWIAQQSGKPGEVALYMAPPKYCLIAFGDDGTPLLWEDPGNNKHLLNLWPPD